MFRLKSLAKPKNPFISQLLCFTTSPPPPLPQTLLSGNLVNIPTKEISNSFKQWFKSKTNPLFDQIFQILQTHLNSEDVSPSLDSALSRLNLKLSESLVIQVLNYKNDNVDVLSCLRFFDWAGRQSNFNHTRVTFYAIFKILSKEKMMSLLLDLLESYTRQRYFHKVRFYDILVMGYAVSGKPEIALQLFSKMRFLGIDLDGFAYHVLLNALIEEDCFDVFDVIVKQIRMRGFEGEITYSIVMKSLCKQKKLDEAEEYLRGLLEKGCVLNSGYVVSMLVGALCKNGMFEKAGMLVEEFGECGVVEREYAYGVLIRDLVQKGKLDWAMDFLKRKKLLEGYVPQVCRYNVLVCRLLRENRLEEVFDFLVEMKEGKVLPDKVTMNAALCFFCKAGMVDVAVDLFHSREEFDLSPNTMAYNYLINTLCGDGSIDEAFSVLLSSFDQGYFPGKKTFYILADALCREGKLDKMKELVVFSLERNYMPSISTYDKFITALCRARRVEDGYLIHGELNRINKVTGEKTYRNLIDGFNSGKRGDISSRLLIEMQEKGHAPNRKLFRGVIHCLCDMDNPEKHFLQLLDMQTSRQEPNCRIYNFFIDGAGHAKKPALARETYETMIRSGIMPNLSSDILMMQSYLKSQRISDAINFFDDVRNRRKIGSKLYNTMVVGLCKANKPEIALEFLKEMKNSQVMPSLDCYEMLVQSFCLCKKYDMVVHVINDMERDGRKVSTFIGNHLLLHSLNGRELYDVWVHLRDPSHETSLSSLLGLLMGAFSGCIKVDLNIEELEEVIGQCFPVDIFTYNMLLRRLSIDEMDLACELFRRIHEKGYEPNKWSYDTLVRGLFRHGRTDEAKRLVEEMFQKGFLPTLQTTEYI